MRVTQYLLICVVIIAMLAGIVSAKVPASGSAVVDGNPVEWDLATNGPDFWGGMYTDGDATKTLYAKAYVRFDCEKETVYVLVLDESADPQLDATVPEFIYAYIGQISNQVYNGNSPDFRWVNENYPFAEGYEASFTLAPPGSSPDNFVIESYISYFEPGDTWYTASTVGEPLTISSCVVSAPEFPSVLLPVTMIIGVLGAVLLIQRTREP
jgi:hypothetical protein